MHWYARLSKWLLEGINWHRFWRYGGAALGTFNAGVAYQNALNNDRFHVLLFVFVSALYFFTAGKSHSAVKEFKRRHRDR